MVPIIPKIKKLAANNSTPSCTNMPTNPLIKNAASIWKLPYNAPAEPLLSWNGLNAFDEQLDVTKDCENIVKNTEIIIIKMQFKPKKLLNQKITIFNKFNNKSAENYYNHLWILFLIKIKKWKFSNQ